jgi:hypothetical protein
MVPPLRPNQGRRRGFAAASGGMLPEPSMLRIYPRHALLAVGFLAIGFVGQLAVGQVQVAPITRGSTTITPITPLAPQFSSGPRLEVRDIGLTPSFPHIPSPKLDESLIHGGHQQQQHAGPPVERVAERPVIVKDPPPPGDGPPPDGGGSEEEDGEKRRAGESNNSFWHGMIAAAVLFVAYLGLTRKD